MAEPNRAALPMKEPMDLGPVLHLMHSFLPRHEFVVLEGASRTRGGAQFSTGEKSLSQKRLVGLADDGLG